MPKCSLEQRVYQCLRKKIINCEYAPGALLNETQLAQEFDGSRTPIRSALSRLEQENLVQILPKKGILVAPLSIHDLKDAYEVRLLVEPYAVLTYGNKLTEELYLDYYKKFQVIDESSFIDTHYILDDKFHFAFMEATQNPMLLQTYKQINTVVHRARILSAQLTVNRLQHSKEEHLKIVKACLKQEWAQASEAMYRHLLLSQKAVFQSLPPFFFFFI